MENANVKYLVGDVFDRMAELDDGSVDLILTSPPFLALRSYLPADHPDKDKEIGSEATPAEYIDVLLRLTAEWRRLLTPHGSLVVELGDTFSGAGGENNLYTSGYSGGQHGLNTKRPQGQGRKVASREHRPEREGTGADGGPRLVPMNSGNGWPLAKSLTLTPESYRFALAYGINPHTGQPSPAGTWRIRNVIRWVRPNPPVGALGDKFRPATSELVVACVLKDRYFDLDAVRTEHTEIHTRQTYVGGGQRTNGGDARGLPGRGPNPAGAPPLDWWKISSKGYAGAHYAVWPSELCVKPIKAMCPREVCRECGEPRRRIVSRSRPIEADDSQRVKLANGQRPHEGRMDCPPEIGWEVDRHTEGWSDCGHDNYRPGLVLDPFAGTGTTLAVAHGHGRDAIGIDIDQRSAELARERVGPLFLEVVASA